jgi:hypothetical protein
VTAVKETRAEKNRRLQAERDAQLERERQERLAKNPLRLLKLIARAEAYRHDNVSCIVYDGVSVENDTTSPLLRAVFSFDHDGYNNEQILYLISEDWEYEHIESLLNAIDEKKAEAERKRKIAREAYDSLTPEQRAALNLTYRP